MNWTDALIRVRRTNNDEQVFYQGASAGDLNTVRGGGGDSLATWVGANSAFVVEWYDQSGNGYNVINTNNSEQPRIVNAGTMETDKGKPALRFNGSSMYLYRNDTGFPTTNVTIAGMVNELDTSLGTGVYKTVMQWGKAALDKTFAMLFGTDFNLGTNALGFTNYGDAFGIANQLNTSLIYFATKIGSSWNLWLNRTTTGSKTMASTLETSGTSKGFTLGRLNDVTGGGSFLNGYKSEYLIYGSNQTSNRTTFEDVLNNYYVVF